MSGRHYTIVQNVIGRRDVVEGGTTLLSRRHYGQVSRKTLLALEPVHKALGNEGMKGVEEGDPPPPSFPRVGCTVGKTLGMLGETLAGMKEESLLSPLMLTLVPLLLHTSYSLEGRKEESLWLSLLLMLGSLLLPISYLMEGEKEETARAFCKGEGGGGVGGGGGGRGGGR